MLENIIFGPLCPYLNNKDFNQKSNDFAQKGWLPLTVITKGELYTNLMKSALPEERENAKGIVIFFGVKKLET